MRIWYPAGVSTDKLVTTYKYDDAGNKTDVTVNVLDPVAAPRDVTTHYRYDNLNRVIDQYDDYNNDRG